MGAKTYKQSCKGCQLSQEQIWPEIGGKIIELEGDWVLNHYGGSEGFLGWMALQPRYHRTEFTELATDEAQALGENIQIINRGLRGYWQENFSDDPIEQTYITYPNPRIRE